jgi:hypothetical protein
VCLEARRPGGRRRVLAVAGQTGTEGEDGARAVVQRAEGHRPGRGHRRRPGNYGRPDHGRFQHCEHRAREARLFRHCLGSHADINDACIHTRDVFISDCHGDLQPLGYATDFPVAFLAIIDPCHPADSSHGSPDHARYCWKDGDEWFDRDDRPLQPGLGAAVRGRTSYETTVTYNGISAPTWS